MAGYSTANNRVHIHTNLHQSYTLMQGILITCIHVYNYVREQIWYLVHQFYYTLPLTVSESRGTSSWKSTAVPWFPRASPTFLILPTPSTTCTYLGWVHTSLAGTSVSMPQVMGSGNHLHRKCTLWTCVPECSCEPLQCAIQPSSELIYRLTIL